MFGTLHARHEIYDLRSFEATEPIPELGIERGDWVHIDLSGEGTVLVCKRKGPEVLSTLCDYFTALRSRRRRYPSQNVSLTPRTPHEPRRPLARSELCLLR